MYRMDHKYRGHCVVINNQNFPSLRERKGTQKDAGKKGLKCITNASWGS